MNHSSQGPSRSSPDGDADGMDVVADQLADRVRAGEADEVGDPPGRCLLEALGTGARPAGDRGELNLDEAEVPAVEFLRVQLLEDGSIRFIEDHAEADHAGPKASVREGCWRGHAAMIASAQCCGTFRTPFSDCR